VADFKRRCLELLEGIRRRGGEILVTKRGEPIARVTPVAAPGTSSWGILRDRLEIRGDIVHVDWSDDWDAAR
jgi:prevent-host-death family protein